MGSPPITETNYLFRFPFLPVFGVYIGLLVAKTFFWGYGPGSACLNKDDYSIVDRFVCSSGGENFKLGSTERQVMLFLSFLGVFGNVIPKYMKGEGAKRLYVSPQIKRVLLTHIVSGILSVLGSGMIGVAQDDFGYEPSKWVLGLLIASDVVHQLTILRLLKNHDGVFPLRVGNMTIAIEKYISILNLDHVSNVPDHIFLMSFGFMGTRLANVFLCLSCYLSKDGNIFFLEYWYSLGVGTALIHCICRTPHGPPLFFVMLPIIGYCFYHELWRRRWKYHFLAFNLIVSFLALNFLTIPQQGFLLSISFPLGFFFPIFYRSPERAMGPSMNKKMANLSADDPATKIARVMYDRREEDMGDVVVERSAEAPNFGLPKECMTHFRFANNRNTAWVPIIDVTATKIKRH